MSPSELEFVSNYVSHKPDSQGLVHYSTEEHQVWKTLFLRQQKILPGRACEEYMAGLSRLNLTKDKIPQLPDVSQRLKGMTGWQVEPVAALISAREFFELLARRAFPAATFIRSEEEIDYVKEPDIFHELFGHCPMLTNPVYADFVYNFAKKVLTFPEDQWPLLQRMFWFTVEFGLIQTPNGVRAYGGGILSSISETAYSVESDVPFRILFSPLAVFRTPYRIDMLQITYFVIESYQTLYDFVTSDLGLIIQKAKALGEFPPLFPVEGMNPNIHINAC